ncbi:hypothetical protein GRI42_02370 [Erythrobacter gaetbuli]|uniref:SHOCT domain-containing protein n=1 Tax=Qipengyuania gaetbuli TaxID=266952 RepID=A0A844XY75_9SPHN|nr:SHOCT domain-containing protein [Qipengyuania gaetbuli]MXO50147.1 hypothetical protein [Qipengyuania gaetbuli]
MPDYAAIERLAKLRDNGTLSEAEFEREKAAILSAPDEAAFFAEERSGALAFIKGEFSDHPIISSILAIGIGTILYAFISAALFPAPPEPEYEIVLPEGVTEYVTASDLQASFERNEIATIQRFQGDVVMVSGRVSSVDADLFDRPVIRLKTGSWRNISVPVSAHDSNFAAKLNPGDEVFVICVGINEVMGSPVFADCEASIGPTYVEVETGE